MASSHTADITDALFDADVIERSYSQPVLVDFWAPWCGPCRMLGPVLESLASEMDGAFFLAKVNTEDCQGVAASYKISGIPAVKLFINGTMVAEFTGALPETQVRAFLAEHLPNEAGEALAAGRKLLGEGRGAEAEASFVRALELESTIHDARIELAKLRLVEHSAEDLEELLSPIGKLDAQREAADAILEIKAFAPTCSEAGGSAKARAQLESAGESAETCLRVGQCLALEGQYEQALDFLLRSVAAGKSFEDEAARRAMLAVFQVIGIRSETANRSRRKLSIYL